MTTADCSGAEFPPIRFKEPGQSQQFARTDSLDRDPSPSRNFVLQANLTFLDQIKAIGHFALTKDCLAGAEFDLRREKRQCFSLIRSEGR